jgi:hypothetical protein
VSVLLRVGFPLLPKGSNRDPGLPAIYEVLEKHHRTISLFGCALLGAAAALVSPQAQSATPRIIFVSETNACQVSTPLELGGLRFRPPLGIYNNKPNGIYISCSLDTESAGDQTNSGIKIWFSNFVG